MGPLHATRTCIAKYAVFSGRARRSEFWWFALVTLILGSMASYADARIWGWDFKDGQNATILSSVLLVTLLVPMSASAFRRLQDTGFHAVFILLPTLATILHDRLLSIMFDWFRVNEIRIGHPESKTWIGELPTLGSTIFAATCALLLVILALPSNFAERLQIRTRH
ncbi:MAG: DUF805 domain-containing protein [Pseudomonadota bacterium]